MFIWNIAFPLWLFSHKTKVRNLNDHSNCAIWITQCTHGRSNCDIWITQCTNERPNFRFRIPEQEKMHGSCLGTLPIKHAQSSHFLCFCTYAARGVYFFRRKWLERHIAPPLKSQFRGQGIHTAISLRDLRDASLENTSWPSFELHNSNYASQCNFVYTWSKILSFEWSLKLRNLNDHSIDLMCTLLLCDNSLCLPKWLIMEKCWPLFLSFCPWVSVACWVGPVKLTPSLYSHHSGSGGEICIYHIKSYINQSLTGKPRSLNSNWCVS